MIFSCCLVVLLGICVNFTKSEISLSAFIFRTVLRYGGNFYLCQLIHSWKSSSWLFLCFRYSLSGNVFFGRANFCASGHAQLCHLYDVIQSDMLTFYHIPVNLLADFSLQNHAYRIKNCCLCMSMCVSICC